MMSRVFRVSVSVLVVAICLAVALVFGVTLSENASYADGNIVINAQPVATTAIYGESAILRVEGSTPDDEPITYTWYKEGSDVMVGLGDTLAITQINQSGRYYCQLSATIGGTPKTINSNIVTASISPRPINIVISSPSSEYGATLSTITYRLEEGESLAYDDVLDDLHVSVHKSAGVKAGRYPITGTYNNANYSVTFLPATYTITPKYIEGRIIGIENLIYTGRIFDIKAELIGLPEGESVAPVLVFNKAVKNAGDYIAYLLTDNDNYAVIGGEVAFSVAKAPLVISIDDTILKVGEAMAPNYSYRGFVNGETDDALSIKPSVNLTTDNAGVFEVTPYGAESDNYAISYMPGTIQVNVSSVTTDNVTATGSFSYNGNASLTVNEEAYLEINKYYVYSVELNGTEADGTYTVTVTDAKKYPNIFLRGAVIDSEGVRHGVLSYGYQEENFVYTADVTGTFVLYYDLTIPAVIIAFFILLFLIIAIVKGRDRRKYKKLHNRQYIAEQYADRCRMYDD